MKVSDLAHQLNIRESRIIRKLWELKIRNIYIGGEIDLETAILVANEFGVDITEESHE